MKDEKSGMEVVCKSMKDEKSGMEVV